MGFDYCSKTSLIHQSESSSNFASPSESQRKKGEKDKKKSFVEEFHRTCGERNIPYTDETWKYKYI